MIYPMSCHCVSTFQHPCMECHTPSLHIVALRIVKGLGGVLLKLIKIPLLLLGCSITKPECVHIVKQCSDIQFSVVYQNRHLLGRK